MVPFKALYGKPCRTPLCWSEVGKRALGGPWDREGKDLEYSGDKGEHEGGPGSAKMYRRRTFHGQSLWCRWLGVLETITLERRCAIWEEKKLSPRYIRPYQIIKRVGEWLIDSLYRQSWREWHNVFHVSMLRRYVSDPSHVIPPQPLEINSDLTYDEVPVTILDWKDKVLGNKTVRRVKLLWRNTQLRKLLGRQRSACEICTHICSMPLMCSLYWNFEDDFFLRG